MQAFGRAEESPMRRAEFEYEGLWGWGHALLLLLRTPMALRIRIRPVVFVFVFARNDAQLCFNSVSMLMKTLTEILI